ncbi:hypothetical protein DL240_00820 [Lujinxingia litoralis]|uniref:Uncharacterized protein n=1 Tax=Lujinxingia litoralis TaxID=2211119 RepID=A0A328C8M2_9DELT|nr:hypothetical protein [Lujinxingia litoralis]RAL24785.1 hypothetical protein DL240_00820 [Lujinxingia litoralis]
MSQTNHLIAADLPYLLWRTHRGPHAERFPEAIATNGTIIRRVGAMERQIYIQQFEAPHAARALVKRIEAGLSRQHALIGYSLMQGDDPVAIRVTGSSDNPGWMAFPDRGALPLELRPPNARTTLPQLATDLPRRRLVAGAALRWQRDRLILHAALEERGHNIPLNLLPHVGPLSLVATRPDATGLAEVSLGNRPTRPDLRQALDDRLELTIPLPTHPTRKLLEDPTARFWLRLELSANLLCLPPRWRTFDLEIRPTAPR